MEHIIEQINGLLSERDAAKLAEGQRQGAELVSGVAAAAVTAAASGTTDKSKSDGGESR